MSLKLNKKAYEKLIDEDIKWLEDSTIDCLEQHHILAVLKDSIRCYYEQEQQVEQLQAELDKLRWIPVSERLPKIRTDVFTVRMNREPLELLSKDEFSGGVAKLLEDNKWYTRSNQSGEYAPTHWRPITLPDDRRSE